MNHILVQRVMDGVCQAQKFRARGIDPRSRAMDKVWQAHDTTSRVVDPTSRLDGETLATA